MLNSLFETGDAIGDEYTLFEELIELGCLKLSATSWDKGLFMYVLAGGLYTFLW